jgi:superfamily II DNA or RNA helicase
LTCLAYLVAARRIEVKVVIVKGGLFHPKVRIFYDGRDYIVVHGSSNVTQAGLTVNVEQVTVSRSWAGGDQATIVQRLLSEFEELWSGQPPKHIQVYTMPQALQARIVREYAPSSAPTPEQYWQALNHDTEKGLMEYGIATDAREPRPASWHRFAIPMGIDYEHGDFAHQGAAIRAWESAGRRGILEMATGSGKTLAALIAARRLLDESRRLLLVVAAPYRPLVSQWSSEVRRFGLEPVLSDTPMQKRERLARVQQAVRGLKLGVAEVECLVMTHDFLCDEVLQDELARYPGPKMLVADEVHDLGTPSFLNSPPESFEYRLGLSATPVRQYDEEGTEGLVSYFGPVVFQFGLEEAIGKCLVPYEYYVHPVLFTTAEESEWEELSDRLRSLGWLARRDSDEGSADLPIAIQRLLIRRRRVLEQASGKIESLRTILREQDVRAIRHTLVYASDKGRTQLREVNRLLIDELHVLAHQITEEETGKPDLMRTLRESFARGDAIQVLTAMRVLDEGVDIPEIETAYILASTTVERQWVQRRGRVLRKCQKTGKKLAHIHDFLVLPPDGSETSCPGDVQAMVKAELKRIMAFGRLSVNVASPGGAISTIMPIMERYF